MLCGRTPASPPDRARPPGSGPSSHSGCGDQRKTQQRLPAHSYQAAPTWAEPGRGPCSEPTQGQASGSRNLQNDLVTFRRGVWSQEERGGHCPVLVLLLWAIRAGGGGYRPQIPLRYRTAGQGDPRVTPGPSTRPAPCALRPGVQGELGGRSRTHVAQRPGSSADCRPFRDLQGQAKI